MPTPHRPVLLSLPLLVGACQGTPDVPAHPTWADVAPILAGECNHCHGATAPVTGSLGPAVYRFDFYDMSDALCGDAAAAMDVPALAAAAAKSMKADITPPGGGRPRMPPAPAPVLEDWERETIQRWADQPIKGPLPAGNHRPRISVNRLPASAKGELAFIATIDDPDADSVVGVLELGPLTFKMDHPGTFAVRFDLADMPVGPQPLSAVLCDGWGSAAYDLGPIQIGK
jgi:hypothetical protein